MDSADRGTGVESPEDEHPRDRPPPPPPPEQPGAGLPSRAETHKAASELDTANDPPPPTDKPEISPQPTDEIVEETTDSQGPPQSVDAKAKPLAAERDAPEEPSAAESAGAGEDELGQDFKQASLDATVTGEAPDHSTGAQPNEIGTASTGDVLGEDRPAAIDRDAEQADPPPDTEAEDPADPEDEAEQQVGDASEITAPAKIAEAPRNTEAPQPKTDGQFSEDAALVADTSRPEEPGDAESPGETADKSAQPTHNADQSSEESTDVSEVEKRYAYEFWVGNKLVRILGGLDPDRGSSWSNEYGEEQPDPTDRAGEKIVETDNDKDTRIDGFRKKTYEFSEDVLDAAEKGFNRGKDLFPPHPPTGHPETHTSPVAIPGQQHEAVSAGDAATALITAGIVITELYRWGHGKLTAGREQDHGGDH